VSVLIAGVGQVPIGAYLKVSAPVRT